MSIVNTRSETAPEKAARIDALVVLAIEMTDRDKAWVWVLADLHKRIKALEGSTINNNTARGDMRQAFKDALTQIIG